MLRDAYNVINIYIYLIVKDFIHGSRILLFAVTMSDKFFNININVF